MQDYVVALAAPDKSRKNVIETKLCLSKEVIM